MAFYENPFVKFERLLETYFSFAPRGIPSFWAAMPIWPKEKLFLNDLMRRELGMLGNIEKSEVLPILFPEHHQTHSASAVFPSPFHEAGRVVHGWSRRVGDNIGLVQSR